MTSKPLTIGLDIGIASVGWAVLAPNRIVSLGVRAFDKAETAKEGESLNLVRRTARLMRRRLQRRAWRLTKAARLLKREGLIADVNFFHKHGPTPTSPWRLRVEGLDRLLTTEEWARVIYHLCKHRGFHWVSRAEEKKSVEDAKGEGGKVKKGLAATKKRMQEKQYRTAAEMVLAEFPDAQRNKQGDYSKALSRVLLADEFSQLFLRQRELGSSHASAALENVILGKGDRRSGLFWSQKPAISGENLLKMLGRCTFERSEYRAPKASFTAERHVWLTRLNNLRIVVDGDTRPLNTQERKIALPLPYNQASELTHKQLRSAMTKAGLWNEGVRFARFSYSKNVEGNAKDPESTVLIKLPAWQELRKLFKEKGLENEWHAIAGAAIDGKPEMLDSISWVLSVFKDDMEVEQELSKLNLPGGKQVIDTLIETSFDKFSNLSLKALRRILPHMEAGMRYDEACAATGYHHSQLFKTGESEHRFLPPFYSGRDEKGSMVFNDEMDIPRNPVVLRALNQARKVVNALIREYGSPAAVHIEVARELSKPFDERRRIEKEQTEFRNRNNEDKARFFEQFGRPHKGQEFEKWRLYREQQGKCAYSIYPLELDRLLDPGYVEIDHALPYSRSFDDSKNNKVLVLAKENRDKGNRTPYEYLGGDSDSERWHRFVAFVEGNKSYRLAKRTRLLRKNFGSDEAQEFRERNLNDTRYICKFFKNYVERYLKLADDSENRRCVVLSGQLTAFLRARWGLVKVRSDSDRHHALDAFVVAACSHAMVKRLSDYARRKELEAVRDGFVDPETGEIADLKMYRKLNAHFPDPWSGFRHELQTRLLVDDPAELRAAVEKLGTYSADELAAVKPLFVSRAPQRRNGGAVHKETIYAQPARLKKQGSVSQKVPLTKLTIKDLNHLIDPHRNDKLYSAIRTRLEANGGKGDKAFPASNPLRKPDREGKFTGPIVRSVTLVIEKLTGIPIRGGVAKNDAMLRVDVFAKGGKYYLVPVYVHHRATGLPNRAIVAFKDEMDWTLVDDSFAFCFSLCPNDLVRVTIKGEVLTGYFSGCDRSTGNIGLWVHDRNVVIGKSGFIRTGVKTASAVEKFHVNVLGKIFPASPEARRELA